MKEQSVGLAVVPDGHDVTFSVHGFVNVRLVHASPADVAAVQAQLGPLQAPPAQKADITISFVPAIATGDLQFVRWNQTAFDKSRFYFLAGRQAHPLCGLRLDEVGRQCEMEVVSGCGPVPLLTHIVTLTALARGLVPIHGSAFLHQGVGVLVAGWSKSGKTEAVLAFDSHGARYIGDEWVLLSAGGEQMYGLPERIRLWDWHVRQLPRLKPRVGLPLRSAFRLVRLLDAATRWGDSVTLQRAMSAMKRQLNVRLEPSEIFSTPLGAFRASLDKVFFFVSCVGTPPITIDAVDPMEIADRMCWSTYHEQAPLISAYEEYRFAFPRRSNPLIDDLRHLQHQRLRAALANKTAYLVRHPYPFPLSGLYQAMRGYLEPVPIGATASAVSQ